jgi:hypothetical protein
LLLNAAARSSGRYGYGKNTSPHIDAMAQDRSSSSARSRRIPTMPSFTTLLSGLHPYRHASRRTPASSASAKRGDDAATGQARGYVTIGIDNLGVQGNGRGSWFARGFDFYSGFLYKPFSEQSAQLADRAIGFIDEYSQKPFLCLYTCGTPHALQPARTLRHAALRKEF